MISLKGYFISKGYFPGLKGGLASVEDETVSLLWDMPGRHDEYIHEEGEVLLLIFVFHYIKEFPMKLPMESKKIPALLAETTREEKMKGCLLSTLGT